MGDWGQGAVNNTIGWGQGPINNSIGYGESVKTSWAGDTSIDGLPVGGGFADTQSLLYDGVDDRQEGMSWSTIDGSVALTVSMWVKVNSLSATQYFIIGYEIIKLYVAHNK